LAKRFVRSGKLELGNPVAEHECLFVHFACGVGKTAGDRTVFLGHLRDMFDVGGDERVL
jgi:hypothetical protein